jgi:hypothetical protein
LREGSLGVSLGLCRIEVSGEGDGILNYIKYDEPDLAKCIQINRLKWAEHVMRMDNNRTTKRMTQGQKEREGLEDLN